MTCYCHKSWKLIDNIQAEKSGKKIFKVEMPNDFKSVVGYFIRGLSKKYLTFEHKTHNPINIANFI